MEKLDENVLNKINKIYEIASQTSEYWVHISCFCSPKNKQTLEVRIYTLLENEKIAYLFEKEIYLNDKHTERNLQDIIEKIKELITVPQKPND